MSDRQKTSDEWTEMVREREAKKMSQVPVKWAYKLMEQKPKSIYEDGMVLSPIPVVPLSALREVVEGLRDGYTGDFTAYRWALNDLLAHLGEVGK